MPVIMSPSRNRWALAAPSPPPASLGALGALACYDSDDDDGFVSAEEAEMGTPAGDASASGEPESRTRPVFANSPARVAEASEEAIAAAAAPLGVNLAAALDAASAAQEGEAAARAAAVRVVATSVQHESTRRQLLHRELTDVVGRYEVELSRRSSRTSSAASSREHSMREADDQPAAMPAAATTAARLSSVSNLGGASAVGSSALGDTWTSTMDSSLDGARIYPLDALCPVAPSAWGPPVEAVAEAASDEVRDRRRGHQLALHIGRPPRRRMPLELD